MFFKELLALVAIAVVGMSLSKSCLRVQGSSKSVKESRKRVGDPSPQVPLITLRKAMKFFHAQAKSRHDCDQSNTNSACYPQISIVPRWFTLMYSRKLTNIVKKQSSITKPKPNPPKALKFSCSWSTLSLMGHPSVFPEHPAFSHCSVITQHRSQLFKILSLENGKPFKVFGGYGQGLEKQHWKLLHLNKGKSLELGYTEDHRVPSKWPKRTLPWQ